MLYLLFSIVFNAAIYLMFKWYRQAGIRVFVAIVFNYLTAAAIGIVVIPDLHEAATAAIKFPIWFVAAMALGLVFISIFYLMAVTAHKAGVGVATVSSKMSLAVAALFFVWINHEPLPWLKALAIAAALAGVVLASLRNDGRKFHRDMIIWPMLILLGSSVIDFGIAWFSAMPKTSSELALFSCTSFAVAGMTGWIILSIKGTREPLHITWKETLAGILLGAVNYGSIYFLILAYQSTILTRSSLLPVNNLAVVLVNVAGAWLLFREKLTFRNALGVGLCTVALILLLLA